MAAIAAKKALEGVPAKSMPCPLCASKGITSALKSVYVAPKTKIRMCLHSKCSYPFTKKVMKRMRTRRAEGQSSAGALGSDFGWLDELPLDAISEAGSVASTSCPPSPSSWPSQDGDLTLESIEELLSKSVEDFLPSGLPDFLGSLGLPSTLPDSSASSLIDDDDALFAALRRNPQAVLRESQARLVSRAASPASRRTSDVESDAEISHPPSVPLETGGNWNTNPTGITSSGEVSSTHADTSIPADTVLEPDGASSLDLLNNDDILAGMMTVHRREVSTHAKQATSESSKEGESSPAWSPSRTSTGDRTDAEEDPRPLSCRKKLRRRKDLDAAARRSSRSFDSQRSHRSWEGPGKHAVYSRRRYSSSESSSITLTKASAEHRATGSGGDAKSCSGEISRPSGDGETEAPTVLGNLPDESASVGKEDQIPVEVTTKASVSDDDDSSVNYRPRRKKIRIVSDSSVDEEPVGGMKPSEGRPSMMDLFGEVSDGDEDSAKKGSKMAEASGKSDEGEDTSEIKTTCRSEEVVSLRESGAATISATGVESNDGKTLGTPIAPSTLARVTSTEEKKTVLVEGELPENREVVLPFESRPETRAAPSRTPDGDRAIGRHSYFDHHQVEEGEYSPVISSPEWEDESMETDTPKSPIENRDRVEDSLPKMPESSPPEESPASPVEVQSPSAEPSIPSGTRQQPQIGSDSSHPSIGSQSYFDNRSEDEYSPVISSPELEDEPRETDSRKSPVESLRGVEESVPKLPESAPPEESLASPVEVHPPSSEPPIPSVTHQQPQICSESSPRRASVIEQASSYSEEDNDGWTFSECSGEELIAAFSDDGSRSSSTYSHSSQEGDTEREEVEVTGNQAEGKDVGEIVDNRIVEDSSSFENAVEDSVQLPSVPEISAVDNTTSEDVQLSTAVDVEQVQQTSAFEDSSFETAPQVTIEQAASVSSIPACTNVNWFEEGSTTTQQYPGSGMEIVNQGNPDDTDVPEPFPDDTSVESLSEGDDKIMALQPLQLPVEEVGQREEPVYAELQPVSFEGSVDPSPMFAAEEYVFASESLPQEPACVFQLNQGILELKSVATTQPLVEETTQNSTSLTERLRRLFESKPSEKDGVQPDVLSKRTPGSDRREHVEGAEIAASPYASSVDSGFSYMGEERCHVEVRLDPTPSASHASSLSSPPGLFADPVYDHHDRGAYPFEDYYGMDPFLGTTHPAVASKSGVTPSWDSSGHRTLGSVFGDLQSVEADARSRPGQVPPAAKAFAGKVVKVEDRTVLGKVQEYVVTPLPTEKRILAALPARGGKKPKGEEGWRLVMQGEEGPGGIDQVARLVEQSAENGGGFSASFNGPIEGPMTGLLMKAVGYRRVVEEDSVPRPQIGRDVGNDGNSDGEDSSLDDDESDGSRGECSSVSSTTTSSSTGTRFLKRQLSVIGDDGSKHRAVGEIPIGAILKKRRTVITQYYEYDCHGTALEDRRVYEKIDPCVIITKTKPFGQVVDFKPPQKRRRKRRSSDELSLHSTSAEEDEEDVGNGGKSLPWSSWRSKVRCDDEAKAMEFIEKGQLRRDDVRLLKNQGIALQCSLTNREGKSKATVPLWGSKTDPTKSSPLKVTQKHRQQLRKAKEHLVEAASEAKTSDLAATNRRERDVARRRKRPRRK